MIRFSKVNDTIFRCGSPSIKDIKMLYSKYNIRKIISLDADAGNRIDRVCKLLNINHIKLPIDLNSRLSLINFLHQDINILLKNNNGNILIHCVQGRDRTGFAIGLYRAFHDHWNYKKIIKEANSFGFGIGVDPNIISLYKKILQQASKNNNDINSLDLDPGYSIAYKQRSYPSDYKDYSLDSFEQGSWSPYEDYRVREFPYASVDAPNDEEDATRITYNLNDIDSLDKKQRTVPQVGEYSDTQGINGAGLYFGGSGVI